jgi:hypothetical protein
MTHGRDQGSGIRVQGSGKVKSKSRFLRFADSKLRNDKSKTKADPSPSAQDDTLGARTYGSETSVAAATLFFLPEEA